MFGREVYERRRKTLLVRMREAGQSGLILFIGNAEAPAQYKDNCYKWRQDSSWLYYWGLDEPLMAAVLPFIFMKPARENPRFQSWDERAQNSWNFGK